MDDNEQSQVPPTAQGGLKKMHIKKGNFPGELGMMIVGSFKEDTNSPKPSPTKLSTQSPIPSEKPSQSPDAMKERHRESSSGEVVVKMESGNPPKLARSSSQRTTARSPLLFHSYEDKTEESKDHFQIIPACVYSSKYIGSTEHAMECDCTEEWGKTVELFVFTICSEHADSCRQLN